MPKHLFRYLPIFCIFFLTACGQKGALYLPNDVNSSISQDKEEVMVNVVPSVAGSSKAVTLINVERLTIGGAFLSLPSFQKNTWNSLDESSVQSADLIRYWVFKSDILGEAPFAVLAGRPKNSTFKINEETIINAGAYLQIRSLETKTDDVISLLSYAKEYLIHHPEIKRNKETDFLIQSQDGLELYLGVEKK